MSEKKEVKRIMSNTVMIGARNDKQAVIVRMYKAVTNALNSMLVYLLERMIPRGTIDFSAFGVTVFVLPLLLAMQFIFDQHVFPAQNAMIFWLVPMFGLLAQITYASYYNKHARALVGSLVLIVALACGTIFATVEISCSYRQVGAAETVSTAEIRQQEGDTIYIYDTEVATDDGVVMSLETYMANTGAWRYASIEELLDVEVDSDIEAPYVTANKTVFAPDTEHMSLLGKTFDAIFSYSNITEMSYTLHLPAGMYAKFTTE